MAEKKIDSKWLEGLKFHYAEKNMVEKNGRKTLQATRKERSLKEGDILDWKDYPDKVVIVSKDGMKHTVEKNPKPKEEALIRRETKV